MRRHDFILCWLLLLAVPAVLALAAHVLVRERTDDKAPCIESRTVRHYIDPGWWMYAHLRCYEFDANLGTVVAVDRIKTDIHGPWVWTAPSGTECRWVDPTQLGGDGMD